MKRKMIAMILSGTLAASMVSGSVSVMAASAESEAESVTESVAESAAESVAESEAESVADEAEAGAEALAEDQNREDGLEGLLGGLLSSFLDDETAGQLTQIGTEALGTISGIVEELQDPDSELSQGISSVVDQVKESVSGLLNGKGLDLNSLGSGLEELIGSIKGGTAGTGFDTDVSKIEAALREYIDSDEVEEDPLDDAITNYIGVNNLEEFGAPDFAVVVPVGLFIDQSDEENPLDMKYFGEFWQFNFHFDEDGEKIVYDSGNCLTGILDIDGEMDGNTEHYIVTGGELVEEPDEETIEKMCEEMNIGTEFYYDADRDPAVSLYTNLINYAKANDQLKGFQVDDEYFTLDEAKEYVIDKYMAAIENGTLLPNLDEEESVASLAEETESMIEEAAESFSEEAVDSAV